MTEGAIHTSPLFEAFKQTANVMADPRLKGDTPFDGKRLIFGGFEMMFQM